MYEKNEYAVIQFFIASDSQISSLWAMSIADGHAIGILNVSQLI